MPAISNYIIVQDYKLSQEYDLICLHGLSLRDYNRIAG